MAIGILERLAAGAAPALYACIGPNMLPAAEWLFLSPAVRRALSPRQAAILLVMGDLPERAADAVDRIHDQLPHPRATMAWDGAGEIMPDLLDGWRQVLAGHDEGDRLPDTPPNPWRGEGDHGQGGEGMMGGTPYGRPMAMTGEDLRDGLRLDRYTARFGPFAPMLPPGLELELTLQGDVIVAADVCAPPFEQPPEASEPAFCAARILRLLGLERDADRLLASGRSRGLVSRALPRGLGAVSGAGDIRERLTGWLAGRSDDVDLPDLSDLLVGAEWHEAMLRLNSFSPDALFRACKAGASA